MRSHDVRRTVCASRRKVFSLSDAPIEGSAGSAIAGQMEAFSLRRGQTVRATVEFERNFKIGGWSITQIVGRENSSVDPKLKELAGRLVKALSEHRAK